MELTHINDQGRARMVDVSAKDETERVGVATGDIYMKPDTLKCIMQGRIKKGDVLAVAQVAGIMAAKRTFEAIPMCHPLLLTGVDIHFEMDTDKSCIHISAIVKTTGKTGVEMEALTGVQTALLTIYDMCKAIDKKMVMTEIHLVSKKGGKSGEFFYD